MQSIKNLPITAHPPLPCFVEYLKCTFTERDFKIFCPVVGNNLPAALNQGVAFFFSIDLAIRAIQICRNSSERVQFLPGRSLPLRAGMVEQFVLVFLDKGIKIGDHDLSRISGARIGAG